MKKGWEYCEFSKVVDSLRTGLNPRVHFKLNTEDAQGYYVTVRELKGFTFEIDSKTDRINDAAIKRINERSNLQIGDVLFSGTGTIGRTALVEEEPTWWNIKEGVYAITPNKNRLDSKFLIYLFKSDLILNKIYSKASGTTIRSIPMKELNKIVLPIPPIYEQKEIVEYLDSSFAKIDTLKANAAKNLDEAKALFQSALKEALEPKKGWEEKRFEEFVVSNVVGLTRGKIEQGYNKMYPYFKMNNISNKNTLCWDDLIYVDADSDEVKKYALQEGDFLFNARNSKEWVGKSTVYRNATHKIMLYNNNIMRIRFLPIINSVFMCYSFSADFVKDQLEKIKKGTTNVWAIYYRELSQIKIKYPPLAEQQEIVSRLDSINEKVNTLQQNYSRICSECDALKQAILRQVFE